jgi:hypothetical protein
MSLLADSLKGLASISLQTIAEQTFADEIVRPYMEKVKNYASTASITLRLEKSAQNFIIALENVLTISILSKKKSALKSTNIQFH